MNLQDFVNRYSGKSVLWAASPNREYLRGQCVQLVCYYVHELGKSIMWRDAAEWWYSGLYPEQYERIPNSPSAVPQPGDIIIWDRNLPNSGGAGHIAICITPRPGTGTFVSFDSNWGGKTAKLVTHNYDKVIGWLRPRVAHVPSPAPAPTQQGDEMIANTDQAIKLYKMLRPNGGASAEEINGTAGKRTFAAFLNDAQAEIANRDANIAAQSQTVARQQELINQLNQTITNLQANDQTDAKTIADAHTRIAQLTAKLELTTSALVDQQAKEQPVTIGTDPKSVKKPSILGRLLSHIIRKKK